MAGKTSKKSAKVAKKAAAKPFLRSSPSRRKCAISTSARTTSWMKLHSPIGRSKPANCSADEGERPVRGVLEIETRSNVISWFGHRRP